MVNASAQWAAALGYESEDKVDSLYGKTRGAKSHVGFLRCAILRSVVSSDRVETRWKEPQEDSAMRGRAYSIVCGTDCVTSLELV